MKLAKGPRPWPVWLYAVTTLAVSLWDLVEGLLDLDGLVASLNRALPTVSWTQDAAIVLLSATFTIALIPLVAIWFFASRIARIVVTVFALFPMIHIASSVWVSAITGQIVWAALVQSLPLVLVVALLYVPTASRWIRTKGEGEAHAFA